MLEVFGFSDIGCQRDLNEDRILVEPEINLFVIADGMGGQKCGDRAAELAVETLKKYVQTSVGRKELTWPYGYNATQSFGHNLIMTAIRIANRRIWRESEAAIEYTGMGTTIVAAYIQGDQLAIGAVGDSRAYIYSDKQMTQLTRDDSLVARLLEAGAITVEEAANHPMRNVLSEAVGVRETTNAQIVERQLRSGDRVLLTSDGVHGVVNPAALAEQLGSAERVKTIVERIIASARNNGGPDNISCILLEYRS